MKSVKYLENLSEMTGMNDAELARLLGITRAAISQYKSGKRIMDGNTCLAVATEIARITGSEIDPMPIVAATYVDHAEKSGQRTLWENFLTSRLAAATALLVIVGVNLFLTPSDGKAAQFSYENTTAPTNRPIYIM